MRLFSKKSSKKNQLDSGEEEDDYSHSDPSSPVKGPSNSSSGSRSPTKPPSKSPTKPAAKPAQHAAVSSSSREPKPRSARSLARQATDPASASRRKKIDPDIHPLNLPPEQRKRLSAMSNQRSSMDIDRESPNGAQSSPKISSPVQPPAPSSAQQPASASSSAAASPVSQQPSPRPAPTVNSPTAAAAENGVPSPMNVDVPVPPPHKTTPSTTPVPSVEDEAEACKAAGNRYFKDRDYLRAIAEYTKAVNLVPHSPVYLSNRAAAYMSAGKYADALEDCKRSCDLDPGNPKTLLRLARIYTSLGQPEEAILTFGRIQPPPSAKDTATAKEMLMHIETAQRELRNGTAASMVLRALDTAERLLGVGAVKPRKWQLMRGEALLMMGDVNSLGEVQNVAMSLLRNNNQDPEALVLRGRALYAQGENDKAVSHFRKAISCDPDLRAAVKWLRVVQKLDKMKEEGNEAFKTGRYQEAIDKYTSALDVDPNNKGTNSKILQNRALACLRLKQYDQAIADCEKALTLDPAYTKARRTKANALGQAERWEDAVREWKALSEQDPEDRTIRQEVRKAEMELKKSKRKDYYKILAVAKDADDKEIKKAYRKLAVVHHPDKNPGDVEAEARFKDIGEAYETLSDPQKRARYDSGEDLMDPSDMFGGGGHGMHGGIDPEILFSMMGNSGFGGGGGFPGGGSFQFQQGGPRQRGFPGGFNFT